LCDRAACAILSDVPGVWDKRASDSDRERALRALRHHYAEGRLDDAELEERAARAARARTRGELVRLFSDLPFDARGYARRAASRVDRVLLRGHVATYAVVNAGTLGIWAVEGAHAFWPGLLLVPWSALLAGHAWSSRAVRRTLGRGRSSGPRRQLVR
jgi:hypothetical protein